MRLKLFPWLMLVLTCVLMFSGFALYYYFEQGMMQSAEIRLINYTNSIFIKIAENPANFIENPEDFLFVSTDSEFVVSGVLVQFHDTRGDILVKTPSLKSNNLPFMPNQDQLLSNIEFTDNSKITIYQTKIIVNKHNLGYMVVGLSTTNMYHSLSKLRNIIFVVMICNLIILGLAINSMVSLNLINNQKKFLSFASHELRTPLAVILGNAEVALAYDRTAEEYRKVLLNIKEEADWMKRLVSNLLFMFRSNMGSERLKISNFHFGDLLIEATASVKKRYPDKKFILNLCEESDIQADPARIRQVINNLLENSAQNSPGKNASITINLSTDKNNFKLDVQDNGLGIPKKQLRKIFKAFYRTNQQKYNGLGLGLAISKWIVDSHNGKISVISTPNQKTIFTVLLPKQFKQKISVFNFLKFTVNLASIKNLRHSDEVS